MIEINDIKKNSKILIDGDPYTCVDFQHVKPGKGAAFTRCKLKNLKTGQLLERTFKSGEKFPQPDLEFRDMQFLYPEGLFYTFMDLESYEQTSVDEKLIKDQIPFLKENTQVQVMFFDGKPINIELPTFVELAITYCEPGFKGDTATGASKPATLEGGLVVTVPLHMKEGDILKVDTRTGDYVEKVNR
ncbi:MAG TPA: elongation factor P [Bdellovibrionota bacterium]|nr:elongation factor P [Bdellovibrionota bacterium]